MNRKRFNSPEKLLKYQQGDSQGEAEKQKAEADSGVREISISEMECISGGSGSTPGHSSVPPEWVMKDE